MENVEAQSSKRPVNPVDKRLKQCSLYHYSVFTVIFISLLPLYWHVLNCIFLSPPMTYNCHGNSPVNNSCPCDDPVWDRTVFTETMQTKFNIVCQRSWTISFSASMAYAGMLVGSLLCGFLSDKYGRLKIYTIGLVTTGICGSIATAMPTTSAFTSMRFLEGAGVGGSIVTSYVLMIEYCSVHQREIITAVYHIPVVLGHTSMAGISYFLRDFDEFQLAISIPLIPLVVIKWLISESPKWLLQKNKIKQLISLLEKLHKFTEDVEVITEEIKDYISSQKSIQRNVNFCDIFAHKQLCVNFLVMSINFFIYSLGYYGVSAFIGKMSGNVHLNVAASGLILVPGVIVAMVLLKILPRKKLLITCNILAGTTMLMVVAVPQKVHIARIVLACVCNVFYFISFMISFLYGVELFPTSVRNTVLGILAVMARVGQIVTPLINSSSQLIAGIVFGACACIGGCLCCFLPNTNNIELPSTLEELENLPSTQPPSVPIPKISKWVSTSKTPETGTGTPPSD